MALNLGSARQIASNALRVATGTDTFSVSNFRQQFREGVGRPSLFKFKLKRLPSFFDQYGDAYSITDKNSTVSLDLLRGAASLIGVNSSTATTIFNEGEYLLNSLQGRGGRDLTFRVTRAQMPQQVVESYNIQYIGPGIRFPREINNGSITIDIMCSGSYWEHNLFSFWIRNMMDYGRYADSVYTYDVRYFTECFTEAELMIFNDDGNLVYKVDFEHVWPEMVGGENFDWSRKDAISSFPVTLHYSTAVAFQEDISKGQQLAKIESIGQRLINFPKL